MRRSHNTPRYANQIVDTIIQAAEACDPVLINEFLSLAIHANTEHLNLITGTLTLKEEIHRTEVIAQGAILLSLFNYFASRQIPDGLGLNHVHIG